MTPTIIAISTSDRKQTKRSTLKKPLSKKITVSSAMLTAILVLIDK